MKEPEPLVVKVKDQKNKNCEAKRDVTLKKVESREESHPVKIVIQKTDKVTKDSSLQALENKGNNLDL